MAEGDDVVLCAYCSRQRALLHCAQHGARLCLPCDLRLHAAAAAPGHAGGHERAPLCDRCHAAPAAARCADHRHRALLCAPCARAAGCDADGHATRPAQAYTGCPAPAELARILSWDAAAVAGAASRHVGPRPSQHRTAPGLAAEQQLFLARCLIETGGNLGPVAGSSGACLQIGDGDDELFMNEDWPNLDDEGLDDFNFIMHDSDNPTTNSINLTGQKEGTFEEPIIASTDAVLESMASNNAAYHRFSSVATTANMSGNVGGSSELLPHGNTFYASGMAPMLPGDEFPSTNFGFEVKPPSLVAVSSPIGSYQDQEAALLVSSAHEQASSQDMEARTKQQEKRQEAKQRYKDKKKNRRFGKQIMYVSRKVRADTRNRVKGRFAKAASGSGIQGDDQSTQHGDDQPTN